MSPRRQTGAEESLFQVWLLVCSRSFPPSGSDGYRGCVSFRSLLCLPKFTKANHVHSFLSLIINLCVALQQLCLQVSHLTNLNISAANLNAAPTE